MVVLIVCSVASLYRGSVVGLVCFGDETCYGKYVFLKAMNVDTYFFDSPVIKTRHATFIQTNAYNLIVNIPCTTNYMPVPTPNYYCTFFVLALVFSTFFFASCLVLSLCDIFVFFFKTEYNHITFWSRYDNEILLDQNGVTTLSITDTM